MQKVAAVLALAFLLALPGFALGQEMSGVTIKQGAGTPLCKLLLKQARRLKSGDNLCMLPAKHSEHGIDLPDWKLEPPTPELLDFIHKNLLRIYYSVPFNRWYPGLTNAEAKEKASDALWLSIGPQLASGDASIYSTVVDNDKAGIGGHFLAVQTFSREAEGPDAPTHPYFCDEVKRIPDQVILATDFDVTEVPDQVPIVLEGSSGVLFYGKDEFFVGRAQDWLYVDQVTFSDRSSGKANSSWPVCELTNR